MRAVTALVHDRPMLGGNCSGEIGVPMNGAAYSPFNLWARESGLVEEIRNRHAACWSGDNNAYWTAMNRVYLDLAWGEPKLSVHLNTRLDGATVGPDGRLASVTAAQLRSERRFRFRASAFIDCTGDGTLGALAGADFRHGREARAEFGESLALTTRRDVSELDGREMGVISQ